MPSCSQLPPTFFLKWFLIFYVSMPKASGPMEICYLHFSFTSQENPHKHTQPPRPNILVKYPSKVSFPPPVHPAIAFFILAWSWIGWNRLRQKAGDSSESWPWRSSQKWRRITKGQRRNGKVDAPNQNPIPPHLVRASNVVGQVFGGRQLAETNIMLLAECCWEA